MPEISVETDEQKRVVLRFSGDWILNAPLKNKKRDFRFLIE